MYAKEGKKAWDTVTNQIQVEGGTTAQKRNVLHIALQNV